MNPQSETQIGPESGSVEARPRPRPVRVELSPRATLFMAINLGLLCGYLDVLIIIIKKYFWNEHPYFGTGRDFPWTVPVIHALLMVPPGALLALIAWRRPRYLNRHFGSWLLATLALWGALLRLPLFGAASLILAAGISLAIVDAKAVRAWRPRRPQVILGSLLGGVILLAGLTTGRAALREWSILSSLPDPPNSARNVLLIVWDTVGTMGVNRPSGYWPTNTPNLANLGLRGVRFTSAQAPAPWTLPSHGSMFTGLWPHQSNTLGRPALDASGLTIAEYLGSKGYQTAGFSSNTTLCSYESGLHRGFARFEDYPITPTMLLARTVHGRWLLEKLIYQGNPYASKWIQFQARDAQSNTDAFLGWLDRRDTSRPFFAFLNYFDAHAPYIPPPEFVGRHGQGPRNERDYTMLKEFYFHNKLALRPGDFAMAHDSYLDCIGSIDAQLGRLIDDLDARGLLNETLVIVTSDHGEAFGMHGIFGHASGLHLDQIGVPLVILPPGGQGGKVVDDPVSLRDIPATIADVVGLDTQAPFPGQSLAACWREPSNSAGDPDVSPVLATYTNATAFWPQPENERARQGFQMALTHERWRYIRDGSGSEQLFDLGLDQNERLNRAEAPETAPVIADFRRRLLSTLEASPGHPEVETAFLSVYRSWIEELVGRIKSPDISRTTVASRPEPLVSVSK